MTRTKEVKSKHVTKELKVSAEKATKVKGGALKPPKNLADPCPKEGDFVTWCWQQRNMKTTIANGAGEAAMPLPRVGGAWGR